MVITETWTNEVPNIHQDYKVYHTRKGRYQGLAIFFDKKIETLPKKFTCGNKTSLSFN